jgi:peptidoglycan/LPS O-acetylase OafA/YrhL
MSSAYESYRATKSFGSLDALRGLAILVVVWHHAGGAASTSLFARRGFLGVDLFFVLSGFLIVTLLLRERDARGGICLPRFYARRALRIFPLYYMVLMHVAVGLAYRPGTSWAGQFWDKLPYYLTFLSNWIPDATLLAVTWSLAAEEQFYLAWPPLEKFLRPRVLISVLVVFLGLNQALNFELGREVWPAWLAAGRAQLEILQITFTPIALGVGLAHLLHVRRGFAALFPILRSPVTGLAAIGVVLAAAVSREDLSGLPRLTIQMAIVALLATCVVREDHALAGCLRFAPLRRIGIVSYGMYLIHMFAVGSAESVVRKLGLGGATATFVVCAAITYVAAEYSFRYYETSWLKWKRRFESHPPSAPATDSATSRPAAVLTSH